MRKITGLTKQITAMLLSGILVIGSVSWPVLAADAGLTSGYEEEVFAEETEHESSEAAKGAYSEEETFEEEVYSDEDARASGEEEADASEDSYSEEAADASEEAVEYYTVALDANGGYFENEWDDAIGDYVEQAAEITRYIPAGGTVAACPVFVDPDGGTMIFAGWSLEPGGKLVSQAEEEYVPLESCTLFAVWEADETAAESEDASRDDAADEGADQADTSQNTKYSDTDGAQDEDVSEQDDASQETEDLTDPEETENIADGEPSESSEEGSTKSAEEEADAETQSEDMSVSESEDEETGQNSASESVIIDTQRSYIRSDKIMYNGKELAPQIAVFAEGSDPDSPGLTEGVDYEVSYFNRNTATPDIINAGVIDVTITGIGNCTGELKGSYEIVPMDIGLLLENDSIKTESEKTDSEKTESKEPDPDTAAESGHYNDSENTAYLLVKTKKNGKEYSSTSLSETTPSMPVLEYTEWDMEARFIVIQDGQIKTNKNITTSKECEWKTDDDSGRTLSVSSRGKVTANRSSSRTFNVFVHYMTTYNGKQQTFTAKFGFSVEKLKIGNDKEALRCLAFDYLLTQKWDYLNDHQNDMTIEDCAASMLRIGQWPYLRRSGYDPHQNATMNHVLISSAGEYTPVQCLEGEQYLHAALFQSDTNRYLVFSYAGGNENMYSDTHFPLMQEGEAIYNAVAGDGSDLIVTGMGLGGTVAKYLSYTKGIRAVTFNSESCLAYVLRNKFTDLCVNYDPDNQISYNYTDKKYDEEKYHRENYYLVSRVSSNASEISQMISYNEEKETIRLDKTKKEHLFEQDVWPMHNFYMGDNSQNCPEIEPSVTNDYGPWVCFGGKGNDSLIHTQDITQGAGIAKSLKIINMTLGLYPGKRIYGAGKTVFDLGLNVDSKEKLGKIVGDFVSDASGLLPGIAGKIGGAGSLIHGYSQFWIELGQLIYAGAFPDNTIFVGGKGDDIMEGSPLSEWYFYSDGDGHDTITDGKGKNTDNIYLVGIDQSRVTWQFDPNIQDMLQIMIDDVPSIDVHINNGSIGIFYGSPFDGSDLEGDIITRGDLTDLLERLENGDVSDLHQVACPVDMLILDADGNVVQELLDGTESTVQNEQGFFEVERIGDEYVKTAILYDPSLRVALRATGDGTMLYAGILCDEEGRVTDSAAIENIPVTNGEMYYVGEDFSSAILERELPDGTKGEDVAFETSLQLDSHEVSLNLGEQKTLSVQFSTNSVLRDYYWFTTDDSIVTVGDNGVVTAVGEGEASIVAMSLDGSYTYDLCRFTVTCEGLSAENFIVDGISDYYTFTGRQVEISLDVSYPGLPLTEGVDYELSFPELIEAGEYEVSVNGLGRFQGTKKLAYEIRKPQEPASVNEKVQQIVQQCQAEGITDEWETALWLHDWLTENANYDYTYTYYTADGVLLHGTGVCNSYALAYSSLLTAAGIENQFLVSATEMNHAWNVVKIDGQWCHVDCTWDDPGTGGAENHQYFGMSDDMIAVDHRWDRSRYPVCTTETNYYPYRMGAAVFSTQEEVYRLLDDAATNKQEEIELYYLPEDPEYNAMGSLKKWYLQYDWKYGIASFEYDGNGFPFRVYLEYTDPWEKPEINLNVDCPDFTLHGPEGTYSLQNYSGNAIVLIFGRQGFFNTFDILDGLHRNLERLRSSGVEVVLNMLGAYTQDDIQEIKDHYQIYPDFVYTYGSSSLCGQMKQALGGDNGTLMYPEVFLIDKDGRIVRYSQGYVDDVNAFITDAIAASTGKELPAPGPVDPGDDPGVIGTVDEKVQDLVADCNAAGLTDEWEIALWLHDWITKNATLDATEYDKADGVLLHGGGTWQSYVLAYQLLLNAFGIENRIVDYTGTYRYQWNLVKLNGHWCHVDCTEDDFDVVDNGHHSLFGLTDEMMANKGGKWDRSAYPSCTFESNYYPYHLDLPAFTTKEELYDLLADIASGKIEESEIYYVPKDHGYNTDDGFLDTILFSDLNEWFCQYDWKYGIADYFWDGNLAYSREGSPICISMQYTDPWDKPVYNFNVPCPDFTLHGPEGTYSLQDYSGNAMILIFGQEGWFNSTEVLEGLHSNLNRLRSSGVEVIMNMKGTFKPDDFTQIKKDYPDFIYTYEEYGLLPDMQNAVGDDSHMFAYPEVFLIDEDGNIVRYWKTFVEDVAVFIEEAIAASSGKALPSAGAADPAYEGSSFIYTGDNDALADVIRQMVERKRESIAVRDATWTGSEEDWSYETIGDLLKNTALQLRENQCDFYTPQCYSDRYLNVVMTIYSYDVHKERSDPAVSPTCTQTGLTEGSHCGYCGKVIKEQETLPALGHDLTRHEARQPDCETDGTEEYYSCSRCGGYFLDAEGKSPVENVPVVNAHHDLVHHEAVEPGCETDGTGAYYVCSVCGRFFEDADGTKALDALPVISGGHDLVYHEAEAPDCETDGTAAYYSCRRCGRYFLDAEGKSPVDSVPVVPAHHNLIYHEAGEPDCETNGNIAYYACTVCGKYFEDADGIKLLDISPSISGSHDLVYHEAVEPGCETNGTAAYYSCSRCGRFFLDAEGKHPVESVPVLQAQHDLVYHEAVEASCEKDGSSAYYSCSRCGSCFLDVEGSVPVEGVPVIQAHHDLVYHEAVEPDCETDGSIAFYVCSVCGKEYVDESGRQELTGEKTIPHGHDYQSWVSNGDGTHDAVCSRDESHRMNEKCSYTYTVLEERTENTPECGMYTCEKCGYYIVVYKTDEISTRTVTLSEDTFTYDAKYKWPEVTIDGLTENVDYWVSYADNIEAGQASVIIHGYGNFTGTLTVPFTILPASIAEASVETENQGFTGKPRTPAPYVWLENFYIEEGVDYDISYENNTEAGTATIIVTGKGNFTGTATGTFQIINYGEAPEYALITSRNGITTTTAQNDRAKVLMFFYTNEDNYDYIRNTFIEPLRGKTFPGVDFVFAKILFAEETLDDVQSSIGTAWPEDVPGVYAVCSRNYDAMRALEAQSGILDKGYIYTPTIFIVDRQNRILHASHSYVEDLPSLVTELVVDENAPAETKPDEAYTGSSPQDYQEIGLCGDRAVWKYYSEGTLRIDGRGDLWDNVWWPTSVGWLNENWTEEDTNTNHNIYANDIKKVVVGSQIGNMGAGMFTACQNLTEITFLCSAPDLSTPVEGWEEEGFSTLRDMYEGYGLFPYGKILSVYYPKEDASWTPEMRAYLESVGYSEGGYKWISINKDGVHTHTWGAWKTTKAATVQEEGSKQRTCTECGKKQTAVIEKLAPTPITDASVTFPDSIVYTGKALTPAVTVTLNGKTLKKNEDYTITYSNNTNAGNNTASATITGKGNYTGTQKCTFTISRAAQTITASNLSLTYLNSGTITASGNKGKLTYKSGNTAVATVDASGKVKATGTGSAKITITAAATSNYNAGTKQITVTVTKAAQSITATSKAASAAVGKTVTVSTTGAQGKVTYKSSDTAIATVNTTSGVVTAKKVGTVKITATAAATANYNAASKTVTIKVVPAATKSLTTVNQAKGIKLTWEKVTGANGYKVYRGSTLIKTITSVSTVTYADTAANTNGTKYTYKVVAKASTGDSTLSKSVTVYKVAQPAVSSVSNSGAKKMTVKWEKNAKATGYQIQYSTSSTFASGNKNVNITSVATVSKTIGSLTKGKTYYVRIRTYKTVGSTKYWSAWSAKKSVKITK